MKANAPEKIYLFENPISGTHDDRWLSKRSDENDIEYTRTDAFVEKVVGFIKDNIELDKYKSPDEESYRMGWGFDYFETNMFIEDFVNYMKGE